MKLNLSKTIFTTSIITLTGLLSVACGGANDGSGVGSNGDDGGDSAMTGDGDGSGDGDGDSMGDGDSTGMGGTDGGGGDEEPEGPPTVISSNILNGDVGVLPDTTIEIEFSEPMDRKSVEDAYSSKTLPAEDVTFSWSSDWRTLYITPNSDMAYTSAKSLEVLGKAYEHTFMISQAASGDNGGVLEENYMVSFATARRVSAVIDAGGSFVGSVRSDGNDYNGIHTGDTQYQDLLGDAHYVATLSFNLSDVDPTAFKFETANIGITKEIHLNDPFDLGIHTSVYAVEADERTWEAVSPQLTEDNEVGTLMNTLMTSYRVSVVDAIEAEMEADGLAQFAMREGTLNNDNQTTDTFVYSDASLFLTYWME